MLKIAALIVNYNMPERADKLAFHINNYCQGTDYRCDTYLIDNGSDIVSPATLTNVWIKENIQTTRGWLTGLQEIDVKGNDYFAYWFLITSARFVNRENVLSPMVDFMAYNPVAVGIHPSLTLESTTCWDHLFDRKTGLPRRTWMIDNVASLYRRDWFDSIGWFDENLTMGHGIDLETCYLARRQKKSIWIDDRVNIEKTTDIGYTMKRMNMTAERRRELAKEEMDRVLGKKYGASYWKLLTSWGVKPEWR